MAGAITFERVSFGYGARAAVLRDIDLDIAPGEVLAVVGPSGAGKTTPLQPHPAALGRHRGAAPGRRSRRARASACDSLRASISLVPQEATVFGGSVAENIRYGRLEATHEEMVAAARAANAHDFIEALPDGYDTVLGDRGTRLSGGQRQRVAIARAILKDAPILILDEATSSLDNESERLVQEALARLMVGRTTIVVAHRLSTIRHADRIAVLDDGWLLELGSHEELLGARRPLRAPLAAAGHRAPVRGRRAGTGVVHSHWRCLRRQPPEASAGRRKRYSAQPSVSRPQARYS